MSDIGYSQINPVADGGTDLGVIVATVRQMMAVLNVMKLVKVLAVTPGSGSPPSPGTVDVQPLVQQIDGAGYTVNHGTVYGIPVWRFQFGKWGIIADPAAGDFGYVVCADRDSSNVVKNPGVAAPGSRRRYNIADGVYIGGILNPVPAATLWLKNDGTFKWSDSNGNVLDTSSGSWVITGAVEFKDGVTLDAGLTVTGDATIDGVDVKHHIHSGVQTGGGNTGPPV